MIILVLVIAAVVVAVDQASKHWAESALSGGQTVPVIGELLGFRLLYNPGAAFSIGAEFTWLFTVASAAAVVAITIIARRARSRWWAVALALILGGATTHLLDRLTRDPGFGRGHVVDFIDYAGLFVGNVADIALVVGVSLAVLLQLRGVSLAGPHTGAPDPANPPGG